MKNKLLGSIIGDIAGSSYEMWKERMKDYNRVILNRSENTFTDDTIGTIATAEAIMDKGVTNVSVQDFQEYYLKWFRKYDCKGCGGMFRKWVNSENPQPYGSWGNGSAMRVSPVGFVCDDTEDILDLAEATALCSHNDKTAIIGAQAIAQSILLVRQGCTKAQIRSEMYACFGYEEMRDNLDQLRPNYKFDSSCKGSVPQSILCFLESKDYEDTLKLAISMGGDADTMACMAGGIANAFYNEIPEYLLDMAYNVLPDEMIIICEKFDRFVG